MEILFKVRLHCMLTSTRENSPKCSRDLGYAIKSIPEEYLEIGKALFKVFRKLFLFYFLNSSYPARRISIATELSHTVSPFNMFHMVAHHAENLCALSLSLT